MKRERQYDLMGLFSAPIALRKLAGSGTEQAPLIVNLLCEAGLRAVHQASPPGVAVYVQPGCSKTLQELANEHALMWAMCALAPDHPALEREYAEEVRIPLLARRLADRLRQLRPQADLDAALQPLDELSAGGMSGGRTAEERAAAEHRLEALVRRVVVAAAPAMNVAELQIEREWAALVAAHSSVANACLARFLEATGVHVQDASLVTSSDPKRMRLTLLLYDATLHEAQQR